MFFTAIIFILVIGILIFVHELGHFIMAKKAGMKVEEFSIGFPPRIFKYKKGETLYSIGAIPFGGFVKILGEDGTHKEDPQSFASKKAGARAKVLVAGVAMNILFAIVLLGIGNISGLRVAVPEEDTQNYRDFQIQISQIAKDSPSEKAGINPLDQILGFINKDGELIEVGSIETIQEVIGQNLDQEIAIVVKRGEERLEKKIVPRKNPPEGEGAVGLSLVKTGIRDFPWYKALYQGVIQTVYIITATILGWFTIIKNLVLTGSAGIPISGPIGIAVFTGQAARIGFLYLLQFTAVISINLAILNVVPFPALDGGRLLFILIEKIKRSPVSQKVEGVVNLIGFALLILLMIFVTIKDAINFF